MTNFFFSLYFASIDEVKKGSMISPEHSEDGIMPPVAETAILHSVARVGTPPPPGVPDPLSYSLNNAFPLTQQSETTYAPQRSSAKSPGTQFVIDEKELANAVSKAMEVPVQVHVSVSPVEKKTAKRRRIDNSSNVTVQPSITLPVPSDEGKMELTSGHTKAPRRKDCPEENERRRERNRVLARKSRQKKKNMFQTLQKEVARLNQQNQIMKEIITAKLGVANLEAILEKYSTPADDESIDHTMEAASISGSDSD